MALWTGGDGWPTDFPEKLVDAFRKIPNGENLKNDRIYGMAKLVASIVEDGQIEEMPRNRAASMAGSEAELRKFHDNCEKLADQIETLRQPSISALFDEGLFVFDLYEKLRQAQELTKHAFGGLEANTKGGRPKKIGAASVTDICAKLFEDVSGKRPTYTTDTSDSTISGVWPEFLKSVFEALYIEASVASQVRAASEKTPKK
jgi:hypothetical protein